MPGTVSYIRAKDYQCDELFPSSHADPIFVASTSSGSVVGEADLGEARSGWNEDDVYVGGSRPVSVVPKDSLPASSKTSNSAYKLKQYSTDAMVVGGSLVACGLLVFPEPVFSTIFGAVLGVLCVIAGVALKHHFYRKAFLAGALRESVGKLSQNVRQLGSEVEELEKTRTKLKSTASNLVATSEELHGEVGRLEKQLTVLKREVAGAVDQINVDRATFEQEKNAILRHLADEISEADERGDRAQRKLDRLNEREDKLRELKAELDDRRKDLLRDEAKLASLQERLIARLNRR